MGRVIWFLTNWQARLLGVEAELARVDSARDRLQILCKAHLKCFGKLHVSGWCWLVSCVVIGTGLTVGASYDVIFLVLLGLIGPLHFVISRPRLQYAIRKDLLNRGIPTCVRCGYDRSGRDGKPCSECGEPPVIS